MKPSTNQFSPILLVDDEPQWLTASTIALKRANITNLITLNDSREVLPFLKQNQVSALVVDLCMPHISGEKLLVEISRNYPHIPVVVVTATNEIETAVRCMRLGAYDYIVKPIDKDRFIHSVKKMLEVVEMRSEVVRLRDHLLTGRMEHEDAFSDIITNDEKMRAIFHYTEVIAPSNRPVFITGETGVGKELIARVIHTLSNRNGEFVAVNASGMDKTMFSDTLFGHKRSAYSGADSDRDGLITKAAEGTLFLDEIGDLENTSQIKLLRLLQEREYFPLGSDIAKRSSARVICATNRNVRKLMNSKKFRSDLYYRLSVHQIHIPPLRERIQDLPILVKHFIKISAEKLGKRPPKYPVELITLLKTYHFPGNIRELQNMIFDAVAQHVSGTLPLDHFMKFINVERKSSKPDIKLVSQSQDGRVLYNIFGRFPTFKEMEKYIVLEAMKEADNNQGVAASLLGITRQALNRRLKNMCERK